MTLRFQHGSRQRPRTLASALPLISEATDINIDPECSRATDSDMAPLAAHTWKSPWHLVPVQAGHSDLYGHGCSMTLRFPTGLRRWFGPLGSPWLWWQHRSWISTQTPTAEAHRSRCHYPGPGDKQATNISPHHNGTQFHRCQVGLWMSSGSPG